MKKYISISLGNYFDSFIEKRIAKGRYKNANEVIRAGLRLLEVEEDKAAAVKASAQDVFYGIETDFDAKKFMDSIDFDDELFLDEKLQADKPDLLGSS